MSRLSQSAIDELKKLDLAALVARDLGPAKAQRNGHLLWLCPFHNDHHPSFDVNTSTNRAYCNVCPKSLDPISWTMEFHRMNFREAVRRLGAMPDLSPVQVAAPAMVDKPYAPPAAEWQMAAGKLVQQCRENLWASTDGAARVRAYLHRRGLSNDTLQRWSVGYNPKSQRLNGLWSWAGITLPAYMEGALWGVKIRLLPEHPARCQGCGQPIPGAGACPKCGKGNKYRAVKGSEPALFGVGTLPRRVCFVAEGEFDAMLLYQECSELGGVVSSTNGAGKTWRAEWVRHLLECDRLITVYDNDEAGERGGSKVPVMGGRVYRATVPDGRKDIADYHLAGGQLYAWLHAERLVALAGTELMDLERRAADETLPPPLRADYRAGLVEWYRTVA